MKDAVVLLSGGIDSATVAAMAKEQGFILHCLTFDYGQRHRAEIAAARILAQELKAQSHLITNIDLRVVGGSALTSAMDVPKDRPQSCHQIPITYVPARNTIFLAYALGYAEVLNTGHIFIGVNSVDYSGYPDCRPEYIAAFTAMANLACKLSVEGKLTYQIHTPLMALSKERIIQEGTRLGVDYAKTVSCYDASEAGLACGHCDSCLIRKSGFALAGIPDPTRYRA
ncbi:MAG: 7-cyano-7-deazaguanine synthase QueC [Deltaproteobacteria bacterium]|nr:7-cyano-7-deazaguanine synthase QueC [Deltaproteobacteria bacterium]